MFNKLNGPCMTGQTSLKLLSGTEKMCPMQEQEIRRKPPNLPAISEPLYLPFMLLVKCNPGLELICMNLI